MEPQHHVSSERESLAYIFSYIKTYVLYALIFLFPLFFLPFTQEYFVTNKLYLLGFGSLLLIILSTIELLLNKKISWQSHPLDKHVLFFLIAVILSIVISSPNKIQALLNPSFGLLEIFSLSLCYFFISREKNLIPKSGNIFQAPFFKLISGSIVVVAISSIVFYFEAFKNVNLPSYLTFLKNANFSLIGNPIDLAIFLIFGSAYFGAIVLNNHKTVEHINASGEHAIHQSKKEFEFDDFFIANAIFFGITVIASILSVYSIFNQNITQQGSSIRISIVQTLPPFGLSWFTAIETLKNPFSALFGVGVDNFASSFTRVKDASYNTSLLWQVQSFNISRSTILQIFTEAGLVGVCSFLALLYLVLKKLIKNATSKINRVVFLAFIPVLVGLVLLPPSLPLFFLVFVLIGIMANQEMHKISEKEFDLTHIVPVYVAMLVFGFAFVGAFGYLYVRSYSSEIYFKQSLNGLLQNNANILYTNQISAINANPYIERFRISYAQTNLLIANNIASRPTQQTNNGQAQPLSDKERQIVAQAIQTSIAEAKQAVALNPFKATNWENLAGIYKNVLSVAEGADVWTVASYQRAIALDPQNPIYRLNLGGVFFSVGNYDQAAQLFEQAVLLKQDWPNAMYNLAFASARRNDFVSAQALLQKIVTILDPVKDRADYDRASADLVEIQKIIQERSTANNNPTTPQQPGQLQLATPPVATITPRIQLPNPKTASPDARLNPGGP
ncbi:MAG: tetratricopeptide repeat protein [Candidatus Roizmanbacteria bacterium]